MEKLSASMPVDSPYKLPVMQGLFFLCLYFQPKQYIYIYIYIGISYILTRWGLDIHLYVCKLGCTLLRHLHMVAVCLGLVLLKDTHIIQGYCIGSGSISASDANVKDRGNSVNLIWTNNLNKGKQSITTRYTYSWNAMYVYDIPLHCIGLKPYLTL